MQKGDVFDLAVDSAEICFSGSAYDGFIRIVRGSVHFLMMFEAIDHSNYA
jgi:hypothetical protein